MKEEFKCSICGRMIRGEWGNDPWPIVQEPDAKCCDRCNMVVVVPKRYRDLLNNIPALNHG